MIEQVIALARESREADRRGEALGLTEDEMVFYDALETKNRAVKALGDEVLTGVARELVDTVRQNATIYRTMRDDLRARLSVLVKRILRRRGYPA